MNPIMTFRESELSRSQRAARTRAKRQNRKKKVRGRSAGIGHNLGPALTDDACMTFREWCRLNGIGERTGRRILKSGNGPVVTQLSEKRIGITVGNNRAWQQSRERA
jgi:hypothetical protein